MHHTFELIAFYSSPSLLIELDDAGIDGIIIDLENKGKSLRQELYNTQVNKHSFKDVAIARSTSNTNLICRINGFPYLDHIEIEKAIDNGVNEILVPMITSLNQVEEVLSIVNNRVKVGLMLETNEALTLADKLDQYPICRFFLGLNDLSIQRNSRHLFSPIADGTVATLRPKLTKPFGMAGLTHPSLGHPIPCRALISEMIKYQCSFSFLRRSFYKDLSQYTAKNIIKSLRESFSTDNTPFYEINKDQFIKTQI